MLINLSELSFTPCRSQALADEKSVTSAEKYLFIFQYFDRDGDGVCVCVCVWVDMLLVTLASLGVWACMLLLAHRVLLLHRATESEGGE